MFSDAQAPLNLTMARMRKSLGMGESFAEAAAFESETYPVSAAVVEDARLLVIPAQTFLEKVLGDRRLAIKMMALPEPQNPLESVWNDG